jgi:hypothetical protein
LPVLHLEEPVRARHDNPVVPAADPRRLGDRLALRPTDRALFGLAVYYLER